MNAAFLMAGKPWSLGSLAEKTSVTEPGQSIVARRYGLATSGMVVVDTPDSIIL